MPIARSLQAILLMLLSMLGFSAMTAVIGLLADSMPSTQMVFLRNILSLFIVIFWTAALHRGRPSFKTTRLMGHFWRASVGTVAMQLWFYSLGVMPITLATALSFTTPIFSVILAILFLGERAGIRRWCAIMAGFAGVLIMLRPDIHGINTAAIIVLISSFCMAISGALVKHLTRTEPPETIVFFMSLFMIAWSLPTGLAHWQPFTSWQFFLVFLIALFSTVAHLLMTRAFMRADLVVLMPFDFTRLIFTAALAYLFFGEVVDAQTITGAAVIVAATVYIAHREARKKKSAAAPAPPP